MASLRPEPQGNRINAFADDFPHPATLEWILKGHGLTGCGKLVCSLALQ
jgi:hypothetical protein